MSSNYPAGLGNIEHRLAVRHNVGTLCLVSSTPHAAARVVCEHASAANTAGTHIHLVNAYTVALAEKDTHYRRALTHDALNLPDGKPLSWVSRLRKDAKPLTQIRGPQFFLDVIDEGRAWKLRHYLLGSTDEVLGKLRAELVARFPDAEIVGHRSPPFRTLTSDELREQDRIILDSGADIVWVGLGTPKQDYEVQRLAASLPVVAIAVGAAFDFTAGTVREAPAIFTKLGLEWAYRFLREPRRLWRRYLFGNVIFLRSALRGARLE